MPVRSAARQARSLEGPGGEDECIQHVVERGSKLLGIKGYCPQDRRVLLRCGHREGAESGGLGDLWIGDSDGCARRRSQRC